MSLRQSKEKEDVLNGHKLPSSNVGLCPLSPLWHLEDRLSVLPVAFISGVTLSEKERILSPSALCQDAGQTREKHLELSENH